MSERIAQDHMDLHGEAEASDESDTSWNRHCKDGFLVYYVDHDTGEFVNKPIRRAAFSNFSRNWFRCLIGMEAWGGAHHWARKLVQMRHQVKLMPGGFVKAFNIRNKSDAADECAISACYLARSVTRFVLCHRTKARPVDRSGAVLEPFPCVTVNVGRYTLPHQFVVPVQPDTLFLAEQMQGDAARIDRT